MQRRQFITFSLASLGVVALAPYLKAAKAFAADTFEKLSLSNDEWKKRLTPQQYDILREEGTEHPFTSALLNEHRDGVFACAACDLPLFPSTFKFDSGTGWPSFFDAIPGHLETKTDYKLIAPRNEYHCARCGGHHGHVFKDGPAPTGLRYCNNGAVLKFNPKEA
jgi:peptide-methionine (R)-S-oxide reductase